MPDQFIDPLRDPRHPDRPQSAEFWRLVEIGLKHDADTAQEGGLVGTIEKWLPEPELRYYAEHRLGTAGFNVKDPHARAMLIALYYDAFCKGAEYATSQREN